MRQWLKTQVNINKSAWTAEESDKLKQLVKEYGTKHWTKVALIFNSSSLYRGRTREQCKKHWEDYLSPKKCTKTEELHLLCFWMEIGNEWKGIGKLMHKSNEWVKTIWKQILDREGWYVDENLQSNVAQLIERIKREIEAEDFLEPANNTEVKQEALSDHVDIEIEGSNVEDDMNEGKVGYSILTTKENLKPHSRKYIKNSMKNKDDT